MAGQSKYMLSSVVSRKISIHVNLLGGRAEEAQACPVTVYTSESVGHMLNNHHCVHLYQVLHSNLNLRNILILLPKV